MDYRFLNNKKMINGTYIKILEYLSERNINQKTDLNDLFDKLLKNGNTEVEIAKEKINPKGHIKEFLTNMESNGHIFYSTILPEEKYLIREAPDPIWAAITANGLDFLFDYQMKMASIKSFEFIKIQTENIVVQTRNIRRQTCVFVFAAMFALGSFCIAYKTFTLDKKKEELLYQIKLLQQDNSTLKNQLFQKQTPPQKKI
jgi:hypothetical protein